MAAVDPELVAAEVASTLRTSGTPSPGGRSEQGVWACKVCGERSNWLSRHTCRVCFEPRPPGIGASLELLPQKAKGMEKGKRPHHKEEAPVQGAKTGKGSAWGKGPAA